MAQESQKTSIWTWLLPMMMGALISLVTDQLSEMQQNKEAHRERQIEEGRKHFMEISQLTGELFSTTKTFLEELDEGESTEISTLMKDYNKVLSELNVHEIQYMSVLQYHFDVAAAKNFEEGIIEPLRAYHKRIDHAVLSKQGLDLSPADHQDLERIKDRIITFNMNFLEYISQME
jgi:hypothetical protein